MIETKLKDLVDINALQKMQDGFSNLTGMSAVIIDGSGTVTKISNSNEFCTRFNKNSVFGGERNADLQQGRASVYVLPSGLTEIAVPIVVSGMQIGIAAAGLVLTEKPDEEDAVKFASEINISANEYSSAIRKVKVITRMEIEQAADFLLSMAEFITSTAKKETVYSKTINLDTVEGMKEVIEELYTKVKNVNELIQKNYINNKKLQEQVLSLKNLADDSVKKVIDTKDTVKVIQDIAMNTRILGFNASIEASRAKESGKGFGVIAQEVRSLADVSKLSADKIEGIIQTIGTDSEEISESVKATQEVVDNNMNNANNMGQLLKEISAITQQLK